MPKEQQQIILSQDIQHEEEQDYLLGEYPEHVPVEMVVGTAVVLGDQEKFEQELLTGNAGKVSAALQEKGRVVAGVARGARQIGLHVWKEHPGPVEATIGGVLAGTLIYAADKIITFSRHRDNPDETR